MRRAGSAEERSGRVVGRSDPVSPLLFIGGPGDATAKGEIELTAVTPTAPEGAGK